MDATRLPEPQPIATAAPEPAVTPAAPAPLDASRTIADQPGPIGARFIAGTPQIQTPTGTLSAAADLTTGAPALLLIVDPRVLPNAAVADRALRELKQLAKVKSEKVLRVLDQGRTVDGHVYIASEAVSGPTLEELVQREGPLSFERARAIVLDVGEALVEAQKVGVIHRDLSPRNVFAGDKIKLTGFGVAEPIDDKVFGTPAFLSPEQAEGKPVDQRSNIYSLGALLYYMVTGEPPFAGDPQSQVQQHLHAQAPPPSQKRAGLPADLDKVVLKALEKSGGRRHLTLRQLLNDVEAITASAPAATSSSPLRDDVGMAKTIMGMEIAMRNVAATAEPVPLDKPIEIGLDRMVERDAPTAGNDLDATNPTLQPVTMDQAMAAAAARNGAAAPASISPVKVAEANASTMIEQRLPDDVVAAAKAAAAAAAAPHTPASIRPSPGPAMEPSPVVAAAPAPTPASNAPKSSSAPTVLTNTKATPAPVGKGKKGFRETAWFKKGELDEELARKSAELTKDDPLAGPAATEAVVDESTLTADDRARLSLKTGRTEMMQAIKPQQLPGEKMTEEDVIAEMETGSRRGMVIAGAAIGLLALAAALYFIFVR